MNATSGQPVTEVPWLTYAKALLFILPAIIAWGFACDKLMPMAKEICVTAGFHPSHLGHSGWIWSATSLLADWGRSILVAGVLAVVLMELVAPGWRRRRLVLGVGIWLANLAVLFALCTLLVIVLLAASGLARSR